MNGYASLLAVVFAVLANPETAGAEDWPTFMHDSHRSGVTAERLELPLSLSWVFKATHRPEPAWPGPAEQDYWHRAFNLRSTVTYDRAYHVVGTGSMVFFGSSSDDKVYALDARTGRQRWTFFTEGPVRLAPFVSGEKVYVGSDDGHIYCLSRDTGSLLWKHKPVERTRMIPGNGRIISTWPVRTGLLVDEGNLYFAAGLFPNQGTLLSALNAEDGSLRWARKVDISPQGYLLASEERLYVPTGRTNPAIFARADGRPLGELPSAGGTFALLTEDVLVTGPGRQSQELNASDVGTKDRIAKFGGVRMLVNGATAYMQSEKSTSAFNRGRYLELSRQRNALMQQHDKISDRLKKVGRNAAQAKPLQERLGDLATQIGELSEKMKSCYLWTVRSGLPYSMIMAGDVLFAGGENEVAAFRAQNGEVVWSASVEGKAYGLSVVNGGLYVSTDEGRIHCFRHGARDSAKVVTAETGIDNSQADSPKQRHAEAAKLIIEKTGIEKGYCLVLDGSRGKLACELARRSELKIICFEDGADDVAAARNAIDEAGLYGRVVVHHGNPAALPYTDYFANLVVTDGEIAGSLADEAMRVLRPSGGVIAQVQQGRELDADGLVRLFRSGKLATRGDISVAWAERKPLEGAGEWTHTYAEPGNSACSGDRIIKGQMALQWFGRPGPREMIDRHHRNVPPLYKDGRLFVPGDCVVFAVDAYNGTVEWKIEVPNSRRLGVFLDTSNLAVDEKFLYMAAEDKCLGFDVRTGQRRISHQMPQLRSEPREWSYVAYSGDILFGSGRKQGGSYTETSYEGDNALWYQDMKVVVSDYLFGMDKRSGDLLWKYNDGLILNTTITVADGRMYFIETTSSKALADKLGRMPVKTLFDGGDQNLVALDARSGEVIFRQKIDVTYFEEPVYLNYAEGVLLLSGSRLADRTVRYHYRAFDARSGAVLWDADHATTLNRDGAHGEYNRHPTIVDATVYAWPYAYNLKTGKKIEGWEFDRHGHGCGGVSASAQALFWRGGNPWMHDLGPGGGPQQLTRATRQGCWINIIPAGGLALIPESSSGCTCGFAMQTSLAFIPQ